LEFLDIFKLLYDTCNFQHKCVEQLNQNFWCLQKNKEKKKRRDIKDNVKILKFKPCCKELNSCKLSLQIFWVFHGIVSKDIVLVYINLTLNQFRPKSKVTGHISQVFVGICKSFHFISIFFSMYVQTTLSLAFH